MRPPRPHPLARARLVDRANGWLESAWRRGILSYPSLDSAALLAKGSRGFDSRDEEGGRDASDVADFRERLTRLCRSLEEEAALNPLGRAIAHGQLARVVRQRYALGRLWREEPSLPRTTLAPPVIVVGQMRSGTTRVHRLLAADPAHSATRFCDSWHPVPERPDLRPLWSGAALFLARRFDPWIDTLHPFGAARADEELGWLAAALNHCAYEAQWRVRSFTAWSEALDPAPVYREFARILATDVATRGHPDRPRVLKVPQFAEDLPELLAQFPGARLVVARREPIDVARSAASLVANQMAIQSDAVDLAWIEREWDRKIALRQARMEAALGDFSGPVAEVDFVSLDADWWNEIERVYRVLGLDLTPEALNAMTAEQARSARAHHHAHKAALEAFASA